MKCAILDFNYTSMHLMINTIYIKALSSYTDIDIYDTSMDYAFLKSKSVNIKRMKYIHVNTKSAFLIRLIGLLNIIIQSISINFKNYDKVFILGYDIISFSFGRIFLPNKRKLYLFHHMQIDELQNRIKRFFFLTFMGTVNHIVLGDFIKRGLLNILPISEDTVFILNHPSYEYDNIVPDNSNGKKIFSGLSYSNDENIITEIINIENEKNILARNNVRLILKSKKSTYNSDGLVVFTGSLDRQTYDNYFKNSVGIVILLNSTFKYRISGVMIDALSYKKPVFCTNILSVQEYSSIFSGICFVGKSTMDIIRLLINWEKKDVDNKMYEKFILESSLSSITIQAKAIFQQRKKEI